MKWSVVENSKPVVHKSLVNSLDDQLIQVVWHKLFSLLSSQVTKDWDSIKVEIWTDSGRIIIFPSLLGKDERNEEICIEITDRSLLEAWESLADSDVDDDMFDNEVRVILTKIVESFSDVLKLNFKELSTFYAKNELKIVFTDGSELISEANIKF